MRTPRGRVAAPAAYEHLGTDPARAESRRKPDEAGHMTPLCAAIVRDHQVRKSRAQKAAFRELVRREMRKEGVFFREERAKGLLENVNLVYGNLATAEFVFGAHYDTCAELPFPNLAVPLNIPLSILMQLLLMLMLALPAALGAFLTAWLGAPVGVAAAGGRIAGRACTGAGHRREAQPPHHERQHLRRGGAFDAACPPAQGAARARGRGCCLTTRKWG